MGKGYTWGVAKLHLVCGPVGAGKTTRARALAAEVGGVVFSLDEWILTMFGPDASGTVTADWIQARVVRCEEQIWRVARRLLELGTPVVLDLGFMLREQRDRYRRLGGEVGAATELHVVDAPIEVRRARVKERNERRTATFTLPVSDALFDWIEQRYQPPADGE